MKALRIIAALLAGLLVAYVVSFGPALRWMWAAPDRASFRERSDVLAVAYLPIMLLRQYEPAWGVVRWYQDVWVPHPRKVPPDKKPDQETTARTGVS